MRLPCTQTLPLQMVDFVAPRALEEAEIPAVVEQYRCAVPCCVLCAVLMLLLGRCQLSWSSTGESTHAVPCCALCAVLWRSSAGGRSFMAQMPRAVLCCAALCCAALRRPASCQASADCSLASNCAASLYPSCAARPPAMRWTLASRLWRFTAPTVRVTTLSCALLRVLCVPTSAGN